MVVNPGPPAILSVVNAADGNGLSPGVLATVFGQNFGSDAEVLVEYQPAPILFRNGTQINFQVPYEMGTGPVKVQVRRGGVTSAEKTANLTETSPAAFQHRGFAIVTDSDWRLVGNDEEPVTPGQTYTLWLTGCGPTVPTIATGQPSPADPLATTFLPVRLAFGGQDAEVLFSGMTPGLIGVCQVNFILPGTSGGGDPQRIQGEISVGSSSSRFEVFSN